MASYGDGERMSLQHNAAVWGKGLQDQKLGQDSEEAHRDDQLDRRYFPRGHCFMPNTLPKKAKRQECWQQLKKLQRSLKPSKRFAHLPAGMLGEIIDFQLCLKMRLFRLCGATYWPPLCTCCSRLHCWQSRLPGSKESYLTSVEKALDQLVYIAQSNLQILVSRQIHKHAKKMSLDQDCRRILP